MLTTVGTRPPPPTHPHTYTHTHWFAMPAIPEKAILDEEEDALVC